MFFLLFTKRASDRFAALCTDKALWVEHFVESSVTQKTTIIRALNLFFLFLLNRRTRDGIATARTLLGEECLVVSSTIRLSVFNLDTLLQRLLAMGADYKGAFSHITNACT